MHDLVPPGLSVRALAAGVAAGRWTAAAVAEATLGRIARDDAALGAFTATLGTDAAAAAAGRLRGPLAGVPVGVKDIFDTRDLPTAYGSPAIYPPRTAQADAAIVALLRRAGALVIGKTSTTEFAYLHPTATRNPRAPGHTPGGSSAGSAAAVAAGLVPLAIGTQTGGSVIRPASYCGVVGYKPSFGWLPVVGLKCFSWSLDTVGLFTRDVADAARCGQILTGRALTAPPTAPPQVVAVPEGYPWGAPSASAERALEQGAQALRAAGVAVRRVMFPPWAAEGFEAHAVIQGFEAWRCLARELDDHANALSPLLRGYLQGCEAIDEARYEAAQRAVAEMRLQADGWLRGVDALLTLSAPDEPPLGLGSTGTSSFNRLWTLLGVPCLNVPGLRGMQGAPMGLQLIAPYGEDARVMAVGHVLERAISSTQIKA